jgi:NADPH:quinone reductase-like Zn-dependent oxidoreductase
MKAITQDRYGPPEVLELRDVEAPVPGDGEVLVEVRAAGVEPGVWIFMTGSPYLARLGSGLRRPRVAVRGREFAGTVAAVGPGVTAFKPGDEVYGTTNNGTYAEFTVAPQTRVARKPANLTFEQAAAVPVSAQTALEAVRRAEVAAGQRVLVIGASGGVGSFAVQLAKSLGAHVTGMCRTDKLQFVRSLGADEVVDYTTTEVDAGGPQYDVIIDTGGDRPLRLLRRAMRPHGTLALVGGGYHKGGLLAGYGRQLLRAPLMSLFVGQRLRNVTARERAEHLDHLRDLIETGAVTPAIDRMYALAETPDAIRRLRNSPPESWSSPSRAAPRRTPR